MANSSTSKARGDDYDAVVVGSGPNGLTAANLLARAGLSVLVLEGQAELGGGARTQDLTLPGFHHDVCSAIHPMGVVSPAFRALDLPRYGLQWVHPAAPLAHPLPDGSVALLERSPAETGSTLGPDAVAWASLVRPFLAAGEPFFESILRPVRVPSRPWLMARFGWHGLRSCEALVRKRFSSAPARALFAGCAAHSVQPLDAMGTAAIGLVLVLAGHSLGWPTARGGSQSITNALTRCLQEQGGKLETGRMIASMSQLPSSRVVLFDLTPRQIARIAGDAVPAGYRRRLERFVYGPGVFKVDWALEGPIPWSNPQCARAATVHVGGSWEEIRRAEGQVSRGETPEAPFVLLAQQSLFDPGVAPAGKQLAWSYCHVPAGSPVDMTDRIERQVERFAPGFRSRILARHTMNPAQVERHNPNMIGGDIGGGANTLWQFLFRPFPRWDPYATPNPRLFICSSSTPPGGGVHGMCGYWAAQSACKRLGVDLAAALSK